jgi:hypothetical protein
MRSTVRANRIEVQVRNRRIGTCWGRVANKGRKQVHRKTSKLRKPVGKPGRRKKRGTPKGLTAPVLLERLSFDGYYLRWHAATVTKYLAFSGAEDESARESEKDAGPIPQGKYTIDPDTVEDMPAQDHEDWGTKRVWLQPQKATVDRMKTCFPAVRTNMYIHGGTATGTSGCIEINDAAKHKSFFEQLAKYAKAIDIEVKYIDERKTSYEEMKCPYKG